MASYGETSMAAVFQNKVRTYGERACVKYKKEGSYTDLSWNEMGDMVRKLASFLISKGVEEGDRVAIFSHNRYEWWVSDLAILSIGAVDVPIYSTNSAEEAFYVLDHSRSKACLVGERGHLDKVLGSLKRLPSLEFTVCFDELDGDASALTLAEAMEQGAQQDNDAEFTRRLSSVKPSDPATIIYTSGTTGPPKGVVLSHDNFVSNVNQVMVDFNTLLSDDDIFLSFLPLSHVLERTAGYYLPLRLGATVAFAEHFITIQDNLGEIQPTIIVSVPRLYEKIHSGILSKLQDAPRIKKALFNWAVGIAAQNLPHVCTGIPRTGLFALKYAIADRLIFSKLKAALGMNRMKFAVSGEALSRCPTGSFSSGWAS